VWIKAQLLRGIGQDSGDLVLFIVLRMQELFEGNVTLLVDIWM
jgi:hypothetical protein